MNLRITALNAVPRTNMLETNKATSKLVFTVFESSFTLVWNEKG